MKFYHDRVIDTSILFRRKNGTKMKLKALSHNILKRKIQSVTHDSMEDCLATLNLVQLKVENEDAILMNKEYHLLRDMTKAGKSILIVDSDIDNYRKFNSIHFEKINYRERPSRVVEIVKKYIKKSQVKVPDMMFGRVQKPDSHEWDDYYEEIDKNISDLHKEMPDGSVLLLNFQINESIRIVPFHKEDKGRAVTRPFLVVITKSD